MSAAVTPSPALPTSADVADLLRAMPSPGAPDAEREVWAQRKAELLARIAQAKR